MAIGEGDRDKIMGYLAYSCDEESIARVQSALDKAAAHVVTESRISSILSQLSGIESQIDNARSTVGSAYSQLREEAQRQCYLLANTLGLEVKRKVF